MKSFIENYVEQLIATIKSVQHQKIYCFAQHIYRAYQEEKNIYIMGNGGSAATASHFACDLIKSTLATGEKGIKVTSLTDSIPLITAWANDVSYEDIFVQQLKGNLKKDDVVILITASGNSPNIIRSAEYAHCVGAVSLAMLGFDGGRVKNLVAEYILVKNTDYGQVEDVHLILEHLLTCCVREKIKDSLEMIRYDGRIKKHRIWQQY